MKADPSEMEAELRGKVKDEYSQKFWEREFHDGEGTSAQEAWNTMTTQQRTAAGKWIRSWKDDENIEYLKETMGGLDGILAEVFEAEAYEDIRRYAASLLLDVFGEPEDIAICVESRPKFFAGDDLAQFQRQFSSLADLWSGDGCRAEDSGLGPKLRVLLTLFIIANALADLVHAHSKAIDGFVVVVAREDNKSAREMLIEKANAIRSAAADDENQDDDDEDWDDDDDATPVTPAAEETTGGSSSTTEVSSATTTEPTKRSLPPTRMGPKPKTSVGEYYEENETERQRHQKGYDALDVAMAAKKESTRELLVEHVEAMRRAGLVVDATFETVSLGIAISLAKFGKKGRPFVIVDKSTRSDVKAGDELVAINSAYIVDPGDIDQIRRFVNESPRPVILTFVRGETDDDHRQTEATLQEPSIILLVKDLHGLPRLVCKDDGTIRRIRSFHNGMQKHRLIGLFTNDDDLSCADAKGTYLGCARRHDDVADLLDSEDRVIAYCNLGTLSLLDTKRTTTFQVDRSGSVRGHDGSVCGSVDSFDPHHFRLLGLVATFLYPDLFKDPGLTKKSSLGRIVRKTSARITGKHGFFS